MSKLDYQPRDSDANKPTDMEYAYGCFPAMAAFLLATLSIGIGIAGCVGFASGGGRIPFILPILVIAITIPGWLFDAIVFKRSHGVGIALLIGLALMIPDFLSSYIVFQMIAHR